LSNEQLDKLRASMSPSMFAANYELKHIAAENAFFTTPPGFTDDITVLRDGISHVDAAYGGEDYTAFTCGKGGRTSSLSEGRTRNTSTRLWTTRSRRSMTTRRIRRQSSAGGWTNITGEKKAQAPKKTGA